jgi:hypothetical protein
MTAYAHEPAITIAHGERLEQVLEEPARHSKQIRSATGPSAGHRGLEQMACAVKLVAPTQVLPGQIGVLALDPRIEIAIFALSARDQRADLLDELLHLTAEPSDTIPGGGLHDLVDVGVREGHAFVWRVVAAALSHTLQVPDGARGTDLLYAVRKSPSAVALLPVTKFAARSQYHFA